MILTSIILLATLHVKLQAYQNELVNKVSRLEEENIKLKNEKVNLILMLGP